MNKPEDKQHYNLSSPWEQILLDQGSEPWESVLDAGTGEQSLSWLVEQKSQLWTAVTASPSRLQTLEHNFATKFRLQDRLVLGTWSDPHLLSGEVYDAVIAQYLLGAMERFDPYQEHNLFRRLRPLVGKRLYVIGLQPPSRPSTYGERLNLRLLNYRDSAFLHSDVRHYREYPLEWVQERLHESGFSVLKTRCFPNTFGADYVERIIGSGISQASYCWDTQFVSAFREHGERLRTEALAAVKERPIRSGFDYLVVARPI